MKALALRPGEARSLRPIELPVPSVAEVGEGRGVLVRVLRVGVDGTDRELSSGEYGEAPPGETFLIPGHESLGVVVETGPAVPPGLAPGQLVVATVRRPGGSIYDRIGLPDLTTDDAYWERGISRLHGFLAEYYVEDHRYLVPLPAGLRDVGVLLEPTTIAEKAVRQAFEIQRRLRVWSPRRALVLGAGAIGLLAALVLRLRGLEVVVAARQAPPYRNGELAELIGGSYASTREASLAELSRERGPFDLVLEATGFSPLAFEAAEILAKNGVLVLLSVTGGERRTEVPADAINQGFVLGNKVMVGSVNAAREDFERGVDDLVKAEAFHPGWLGSLMNVPVRGLDNHEQLLAELFENRDAIKIYVEVAADAVGDEGGP
jgi:threonine dehydrogenase-like Zn-dependent dehydrogenase